MAGKNTVSSLDADIKQQTDKLKKLKEKKKRLMEADNIRLGKLVRQKFKKLLPETKEEQEIFFENLAKRLMAGDNEGVTQKPDVGTPVREQVSVESVPASSVTEQQVVQHPYQGSDMR